MNDILYGLAELAVFGGALVLALASSFKGKYWFALLAMVTGPIVGAVGAARLAKPDSPWARRFYSREKMARAIERFPNHGEGVELDPERRTGPPIEYWLGVLAIAVAAAISARHL